MLLEGLSSAKTLPYYLRGAGSLCRKKRASLEGGGYAKIYTALTFEESKKSCHRRQSLLFFVEDLPLFPVSQFLRDKVHWEHTLLACFHRKLNLSQAYDLYVVVSPFPFIPQYPS